MYEPSKIPDYDDYEILDKRYAAQLGDQHLEWWLIADDSDKGSTWHPYMVGKDRRSIEKAPAWAPLPGSQMIFLSSPIFETLYEGNRGGGKSEMLLFDFAKDVDKGHGENWRGILFRKQLGDLDEMVRKADMLYGKLFPGFRFLHAKADYAAVWPNGERLLFRHLANEEEYQEYHGHQYPWIGFEELTQWENDKAYRKMFSCCRPTAQGVPTRVRANTNPSGVGHNWVKKRFKLPQMSGRVIRLLDEEPRVAIRSDLHENFPLLHSDPGYPNRIKKAASSPAEAAAWAGGNWDVTFGGMFDDLWDKNTHVIPNLRFKDIPKGWRISRAYDHGQSKPFSLGWFAESNGEPIRILRSGMGEDGKPRSYVQHVGSVRGDLVLVKEWYGCKEGEEDVGVRMRATKIAEGIKDREKDWGIQYRCNPGPADTEIWSKDNRGTQQAPVNDFESVLGAYCFEKADKSPGSRIRGWQKMREFMEGSIPGADGTRENPGFFVCEGCTKWLELVPTLGRDADNQDEIPEKCEDHSADMTRYRMLWSHSFMSQDTF